MPFKSSLVRSAGKLFGVFTQADLSLRGVTDSVAAVAYPFSATGGTTTTPGDGYKYHFFVASSSPGFEIGGSAGSVEICVVAGGGSGGSGYIDSAYIPGDIGNNSVFGPPSGTSGVNKFVAYGGGGGGVYAHNPGSHGGSGGGGGSQSGVGGKGLNPSTPAPIIAASFPDYIPGITQGYDGGDAGPPWEGGGGGGAGGVGEDGGPPGSAGGDGGVGVAIFNGAAGVPASYGTAGPTSGRWVGGGGGEGHWPSGGYAAGAGGAGGGGAGAKGAGTSGTVSTGGGGGAGDNGIGAGHGGGGAGGVLSGTFSLAVGTYPVTIGAGAPGSPYAGDGGSGICIIRYLI